MTLRVALLGCGKISRNHAAAVRALPQAELVACCDPVRDNAERLAAEFGPARVYTDFAECLAAEAPDVVHLCTPHPGHEEQVLAAANVGVHILCEKPLTVDISSADRMIEACEDDGVRIGVLFQRRYWPAARRIRAAIDDGTVGVPIHGDCTVQLGRDESYYTADVWRGRWDTDGGGVLMNQAIHYLDLLQWYFGPVETVSGHVATFRHGAYIEVEDTAVATIRFTSGALATVRATTTAVPGLGARVSVTGNNGSTVSVTEFPEGEAGVNDVWAVSGYEEYRLPWSPEIDSDPPLAEIHQNLAPFHQLQVEDFLVSLAENRAPEVDAVEARKALELVLAIYESSRTGEAVRLPLKR